MANDTDTSPMQELSEADLQSLVQELDETKAKADEYLNGWKRALADYQNAKKDKERTMEELKDLYVIQTVSELIPTLLGGLKPLE